MYNIYLPLHVWDREFDSRIVIAYLEACRGNNAIIGHEYNIAPVYSVDQSALLFRAGGPIDHSVRGKWHRQIQERGGIVITQDEEGVNNMPFKFDKNENGCCAKLDLSKISEYPNMCSVQAFQDVNVQLAWSNLHRAFICHQIQDIDSKSVAVNRITDASSVRFDLLGDFGALLQKRMVDSINSIFQNYVLILDNFSVDHRGRTGIIDPTSDLKEAGWEEQQIKEFKDEFENTRNIETVARNKFSDLVLKLAENNPQVNFVFRPHPVLDPRYWCNKFASIKNISVVEKGSIHAWIYGADFTIHSGCTTGLEAYGADVATIDVSSLIPPRINSIQSSLIGQSATKDLTFSQLNEMLKSHSMSEIQNISKSHKDMQLKEASNFPIETNLVENAISILRQNSIEVSKRIHRGLHLENAKDVLGSNSALANILQIGNQLANNANTCINKQTIYEYIGKLPPNPGKSRHVKLTEIQKRVKDIAFVFASKGITLPYINISKLGTNTFLLSQEK